MRPITPHAPQNITTWKQNEISASLCASSHTSSTSVAFALTASLSASSYACSSTIIGEKIDESTPGSRQESAYPNCW